MKSNTMKRCQQSRQGYRIGTLYRDGDVILGTRSFDRRSGQGLSVTAYSVGGGAGGLELVQSPIVGCLLQLNEECHR